MRNHNHYKRNLLSAAVLTLLLGGQAMGANFTTTLTGDAEKDKEYANVYMDFADSYMFDGKDTITVSGASAIKASKDLNIDSPGDLTLITDTGYTYGIDQGNADKVNISLNKKTLTIQSRAEGRTEGIHMNKASGKRQTMNIKGMWISHLSILSAVMRWEPLLMGLQIFMSQETSKLMWMDRMWMPGAVLCPHLLCMRRG